MEDGILFFLCCRLQKGNRCWGHPLVAGWRLPLLSTPWWQQAGRHPTFPFLNATPSSFLKSQMSLLSLLAQWVFLQTWSEFWIRFLAWFKSSRILVSYLITGRFWTRCSCVNPQWSLLPMYHHRASQVCECICGQRIWRRCAQTLKPW